MNEDIKSADILPFARKSLGWEPPITGDWLSKLKEGARFLAKSKHDAGSGLDEYRVLIGTQTMPAVYLAKNINHTAEFKWHDPALFSQQNSFFMTIENMEVEDGNNNQVQEGGVGSDGNDQKLDILHDKE